MESQLATIEPGAAGEIARVDDGVKTVNAMMMSAVRPDRLGVPMDTAKTLIAGKHLATERAATHGPNTAYTLTVLTGDPSLVAANIAERHDNDPSKVRQALGDILCDRTYSFYDTELYPATKVRLAALEAQSEVFGLKADVFSGRDFLSSHPRLTREVLFRISETVSHIDESVLVNPDAPVEAQVQRTLRAIALATLPVRLRSNGGDVKERLAQVHYGLAEAFIAAGCIDQTDADVEAVYLSYEGSERSANGTSIITSMRNLVVLALRDIMGNPAASERVQKCFIIDPRLNGVLVLGTKAMPADPWTLDATDQNGDGNGRVPLLVQDGQLSIRPATAPEIHRMITERSSGGIAGPNGHAYREVVLPVVDEFVNGPNSAENRRTLTEYLATARPNVSVDVLNTWLAKVHEHVAYNAYLHDLTPGMPGDAVEIVHHIANRVFEVYERKRAA